MDKKTKEQFIQEIGELIYNVLNDASKGKYKGLSVIQPISAYPFFFDGNPWLSHIEVGIPRFTYKTGPIDNPEFKTMTLDEYMGWKD